MDGGRQFRDTCAILFLGGLDHLLIEFFQAPFLGFYGGLRMGNGLVNLNVTLAGWPTYSKGDDVVLFLYKAASLTGLRTTVGLEQGKFIVEDGYVINAIDNAGLYSGVNVDKRLLNEKEIAMLEKREGPVKEELFLSFVRKALEQKWFPEEAE